MGAPIAISAPPANSKLFITRPLEWLADCPRCTECASA
jgi:hypothetical protein